MIQKEDRLFITVLTIVVALIICGTLYGAAIGREYTMKRMKLDVMKAILKKEGFKYDENREYAIVVHIKEE